MPSSDTERERRLDEVLHDYLRAVDAGQAPDAEALVARHPDLADELRGFLSDQVMLDRMAASIRTQGYTPASRGPAPLGAVRYFGDYELLEEIARGGMGVVFKARQTSLNRLVALKMILKGELATEADVARFRRRGGGARPGVRDRQHLDGIPHANGRRDGA
jgi:serine/threonine-protein kinase